MNFGLRLNAGEVIFGGLARKQRGLEFFGGWSPWGSPLVDLIMVTRSLRCWMAYGLLFNSEALIRLIRPRRGSGFMGVLRGSFKVLQSAPLAAKRWLSVFAVVLSVLRLF